MGRAHGGPLASSSNRFAAVLGTQRGSGSSAQDARDAVLLARRARKSADLHLQLQALSPRDPLPARDFELGLTSFSRALVAPHVPHEAALLQRMMLQMDAQRREKGILVPLGLRRDALRRTATSALSERLRTPLQATTLDISSARAQAQATVRDEVAAHGSTYWGANYIAGLYWLVGDRDFNDLRFEYERSAQFLPPRKRGGEYKLYLKALSPQTIRAALDALDDPASRDWDTQNIVRSVLAREMRRELGLSPVT